MAYDHDLLEQARALFGSGVGPGRPKQALLRRTVSTVYYALFHLLVREATERMPLHGLLRYQRTVARSFEHRKMKSASRAFAGLVNLPQSLGAVNVPAELGNVASAFVELQEARHRADYDLNEPFTKTETRMLLEQAEAAFSEWEQVRANEVAHLYLALLTTYRGA